MRKAVKFTVLRILSLVTRWPFMSNLDPTSVLNWLPTYQCFERDRKGMRMAQASQGALGDKGSVQVPQVPTDGFHKLLRRLSLLLLWRAHLHDMYEMRCCCWRCGVRNCIALLLVLLVLPIVKLLHC